MNCSEPPGLNKTGDAGANTSEVMGSNPDKVLEIARLHTAML